MYSKPQLEIYADDVQCSHGMATGHLDEQALFYMMQRGIPCLLYTSCSFNEAVREHPDLVRKYLGKVVSSHDNYFAALNSAVFSDGS